MKYGLKLRLKGQTALLTAYTYALFPLMDKCVPVDWKILVTDDVQSQHIRCHPLQDGDELSMLVSNFKEQHAKAVILVNTQDNYSIDRQFLEGMKKSSIPIVVITQSDGASLLASLDTHGDDVQARLDAESDVDTAMKKSDKEGTGSGVKRRLKDLFVGDKGMTMDLKAELRKLMFREDNMPMFVSKDPANFTMVLATLTKYEEKAKEDSHHITVNEALKSIKPNLDELFSEDLPFYLMFTYRLHFHRKFYQCEEMGAFITTCLKKIESLPYKELAQIINDFTKSGDFQVGEKLSMFLLLERACLELSMLSQNVNNRASVQSKSQGPTNVRQVHPNFCYTRMMWLSVALKFHCKQTQVTRTTSRRWYDMFIDYHPDVILTQAVLKNLEDGLELGRLLNLPKELCFNIDCMTDFIVSKGFIRPFRHLE